MNHQTLQAPADELETLMAATLHINSSQDLESMCRHILEAGCQMLGCEAASVMISDQRSGVLHWLAALGSAGHVVVGQDLQAGEGIAGWVALAGQSVLTNEPAKDSRFCQRIDALSGFTTSALLCVPMVAHGKIHGVLEFLNGSPQRPFDDADVRKAMAFASLSAVALENSRLIRLAEEVGNVREISRFKSEMVGVVAHQMRNPLTAIRGFAETTLHQKDMDLDTARGFTERILQESLRLQQIVDSFLDLSGLESGRSRLSEDTVDLRPLLEESANKYRDPQHPITLASAEPPLVLGDADRIAQVVENLLSNAVKYSPDGGEITVRAEREGASWRITVADRGLGVPAESSSRLFHHFYRVPSPRHSQQSGAGLGLVIVKTLIDKMGGKLGYDSIPGQGASFWFTLPTAEGAQ